MKYVPSRQNSEIEEIMNNEEYQEFNGLIFKIIKDLLPGKYFEFTTDEPTYIEQSAGEIKVTANAPTIINGCTGKITINSYAPILVRGSTGGMDAYLRDNSIIEGTTNYINIKAKSYIELIAEEVIEFNGKLNQGKFIHLNAPAGNTKKLFLKGGASSLKFEYDFNTNLYLPKENK